MRVPTTLVACSLALVPLAFLGCTDVTSTRIGSPATAFDRPRVAPDLIAFYRTEDQVPGDYQEVALLHVTGSEAWSTESEIYRRLREEAGRLGANAVILQPVREPSTREKIAARRMNLDMGREGRAIAIYVLPEGAEAPAAPESSSPESPAPKPTAPAPVPEAPGAFYRLILENGESVPVVAVEPAGVGQVKATLPDASSRYLSASKVRSITDRDGRDWTEWVLEQRRRLPGRSSL